ncbi:hypothetical protein AUM88_15610 [Cronobacter sakazakii]|nr:hypothetical protein AUM88_15610 [Cronobacter sakazakii]
MATRREPLIPGWLWPGLTAALLMAAVALAAFAALWTHAPHTDARPVLYTPLTLPTNRGCHIPYACSTLLN